MDHSTKVESQDVGVDLDDIVLEILTPHTRSHKTLFCKFTFQIFHKIIPYVCVKELRFVCL